MLTIDHLVTEAHTLWIADRSGTAVPGQVPGHNRKSGSGLVQALQTLPAPAVQPSVSADCEVGEPVVIVSAPINANRVAPGP